MSGNLISARLFLMMKGERVQRQKNILVVDNNPVILRLMKEFLEKQGHNVFCAEDVFSCLDLLDATRPEILFLDLIMPKINGDDLCRIIRMREDSRHCRIVIVSAVAMEKELDYRSMGADACVAKGPFSEMSVHLLQAISDAEGNDERDGHIKVRGQELLFPRQVTKELLDQNHHLTEILESISQGIIEFERDKIIYVNTRAALFMKLPREGLLGGTAGAVLPPNLRDVLSPGTPGKMAFQENETPLLIELGRRQVLVEQLVVDESCKTSVVMLSDMTELKKMEAVVEAANLTENLGYVFSGIRHEIGNPVNSIKMALSVLQRSLDELDQKTVLEFLDRSLQEIARIEYLLKALKNYSLFESPVTQKFSLKDFILNFTSLVKNDFATKDIELQTILSDEDLEVSADSRALHHVLLNLLTNAADAVENVENKRIIVSMSRKRGRVELKVDDNGVGITEEDQRHLFKPFFTSKAKGTGMGLVNVKKMLSAMNSRIGVESYPGIGTTVTVSFPGDSND